MVKKNTEIATIGSWGPQFRVSFELKISSVSGSIWRSILVFKSDGGTSDREKLGDRIPGIFLFPKEKCLLFTSPVKNDKGIEFKSVKLDKWYIISIQQKMENNKVGVSKRKQHWNEIAFYFLDLLLGLC